MSRKTRGCQLAVDKQVIGRVHGYLHPSPGKSSAPSKQTYSGPSASPTTPHRFRKLESRALCHTDTEISVAPVEGDGLLHRVSLLPPRKSHGRHNCVQAPLHSLLTMLCTCNLRARSVVAEGRGESRGDEGECGEGRTSWREIDCRSIVVIVWTAR